MDLLHVFKQGDPVLIAAFLILVIMSLATWTVMIVRTIKLRRAKKANARVKDRIWGAKSWEDAIRIARENEDAPMSNMLLDAVKADEFFHRNQDTDLASGVPFSQYLLHQIHHNQGQIMRLRRRPDRTGLHRFQCAVYRPVRHGMGHLSRLSQYRTKRSGQHRRRCRPDRRSTGCHGIRPVRRHSRRFELQFLSARQ